MAGSAKLRAHAADFTALAEQFRAQGDAARTIECALLAAQCLKAARLLDANSQALARISEAV